MQISQSLEGLVSHFMFSSEDHPSSLKAHFNVVDCSLLLCQGYFNPLEIFVLDSINTIFKQKKKKKNLLSFEK